jgi:hypothetical protein
MRPAHLRKHAYSFPLFIFIGATFCNSELGFEALSPGPPCRESCLEEDGSAGRCGTTPAAPSRVTRIFFFVCLRK